jgi:hypothetical protein
MGVRRYETKGSLIKGPVRDLLYRLYEWRVGSAPCRSHPGRQPAMGPFHGADRRQHRAPARR